MEAVILTGGKQYLVKKGDVLDVEKIEAKSGEEILLDKILLVVKENKDIKVGTPYVENAKVKAQVLDQIKAKKVIHFKYTRREQYKRKKGHRQKLTRLKILDILT